MATEPQLIANRTNALASTGPVTAEGKSRVSRNAVTSGLFSATDFVLPDELDIYTEFCAAYEADLLPVGALEQTLAAEILHAAWRLRRCSTLETTGEHAQDSIDRARAGAHRIFTRSINELRKLQTERHLRANSDTSALGLASSIAVTQARIVADKAAVASFEAEIFGRHPNMHRNSMEFHERTRNGEFCKTKPIRPARGRADSTRRSLFLRFRP
jgi:hypothetical protein